MQCNYLAKRERLFFCEANLIGDFKKLMKCKLDSILLILCNNMVYYNISTIAASAKKIRYSFPSSIFFCGAMWWEIKICIGVEKNLHGNKCPLFQEALGIWRQIQHISWLWIWTTKGTETQASIGKQTNKQQNKKTKVNKTNPQNKTKTWLICVIDRVIAFIKQEK